MSVASPGNVSAPLPSILHPAGTHSNRIKHFFEQLKTRTLSYIYEYYVEFVREIKRSKHEKEFEYRKEPTEKLL